MGGYGFLAVFACAMTFWLAERHHDYHASMHEVTERLERLLTLFLLLMLGIALSRGLLDDLDWRSVLVGLGLIGDASAVVGLGGLPRFEVGMEPCRTGGDVFFGVAGSARCYYLAYATGQAPELGSDWMWSTVAFTVTASVFIHGVLATPVMYRIGEPGRRSRRPRRRARRGAGQRAMTRHPAPPARRPRGAQDQGLNRQSVVSNHPSGVR